METPFGVREPEAYLPCGPYVDPQRDWPLAVHRMMFELLKPWVRRGVAVDDEREAAAWRRLPHLEAIADRVCADERELKAAGLSLVEPLVWPDPEHGVVRVALVGGPDESAAAEFLAARYGEVVAVWWLGPSPLREVPHPFGSWTSQGRRIRVFFGLDHNGQQRGTARVVRETDERIVIALSCLEPVGSKTLIGGFQPHHADLALRQPVRGRAVIDASARVVRPSLAQLRSRPDCPHPAGSGHGCPRGAPTPADVDEALEPPMGGGLIEELGLGVHAYTVLKRSGVQCIDDLTQLSAEEVLALPNINQKTFKEIVGALRARADTEQQVTHDLLELEDKARAAR